MSILYEATGGGGHEMIPWTSGSDNDITALATLADGSEDKVINAFTAKRWANCDVLSLTATAPQGTNTMGLWEDVVTWKSYDPATDDPLVYRKDWLYATELFGILSDPAIKDNIEVEPIFDVASSEVVSLYAMRIDDEIYLTTTPVGTENPSQVRKEWFNFCSYR